MCGGGGIASVPQPLSAVAWRGEHGGWKCESDLRELTSPSSAFSFSIRTRSRVFLISGSLCIRLALRCVSCISRNLYCCMRSWKPFRTASTSFPGCDSGAQERRARQQWGSRRAGAHNARARAATAAAAHLALAIRLDVLNELCDRDGLRALLLLLRLALGGGLDLVAHGTRARAGCGTQEGTRGQG